MSGQPTQEQMMAMQNEQMKDFLKEADLILVSVANEDREDYIDTRLY